MSYPNRQSRGRGAALVCCCAALWLAAPGPIQADLPERARVAGVELLGMTSFPTGHMVDGTEMGGLSAIVYDASTNAYIALSDDRGDSAPPRWYRLRIDLGDGSLDDGDVTFLGQTTLTDESGAAFAQGSIDPEGLALTPDGDLYLTSEGDANALIPPFVARFDADARRSGSLPVDAKYYPVADQSRGIRNNLAFESATVTSDGRWLFTGTEGALYQDGPTATLETGANVRLIRYDLTTGTASAEMVYELEEIPAEPVPADAFAVNGLVELLAIDNSGTLLALERGFSVGVGNDVRLYEVRTHGALNVLGEFHLYNHELDQPFVIDPPVAKRELLNFADLTLESGEGLVPDNLEGLALGPILPDGRRSLIVVSDNNFSDTQSTQIIALALDLQVLPSAKAVLETPRFVDNDDPPADAIPGDSDDPAIWVHPSDPLLSLVIAALKDGGLAVFNLEGEIIQRVEPSAFGDVRYNNVDVTYGFPLGDNTVDLAIASDRENDTLAVFFIDPRTLELSEITSAGMPETIFGEDDGEQTAYGLAAYRSPFSGKHYVFTSQRDANLVAQLELLPATDGVNARVIRTIELPIPEGGELADAQIEGLAADHGTGTLFIGQEQLGLWRTSAEPDGSEPLSKVDSLIPDGGNLEEDVEGISIYYGSGREGFVIVSSQGDNRYALYHRDGFNGYLGSFVVGANGDIDSVEETDGLDVSNLALGPRFPRGLLVVQDGANEPQFVSPDEEELENNSTGFKLVPWHSAADAFDPPLITDTQGYDPRVVALAAVNAELEAQKLYLGYLGRPGDAAGTDYWSGRIASGDPAAGLGPAFASPPEYSERFDLNDHEALITGLYHQLFNRDPDEAGLAHYLAQLASGALTPETLPMALMAGVQGGDRTLLDNKLSVAAYFTEQQRVVGDYGDVEIARGILASVSADQASVDAAVAAVDEHLGTGAEPATVYRFATYNGALNRFNAGDLAADLATPDNEQARKVAEIIQRADPDVLILQEFDYDETGEALRLFQENYLSVSQNGAPPIEFVAAMQVPSNTGVATGLDMDNDGATDGPGDAQGFGFFPGQYAFAILSKLPIDMERMRSFQNFLWKDMPGAKLPDDPATPEAQDWYSEEELAALRLSSKNHVDIPVELPEGTVHILSAHPTPPVFDGEEDRNGLRNFDEIRLFADYTNPNASTSEYLYDDQGGTGGLAADAPFLIMGDMNADPIDGDSTDGAILQLFDHPRIAAVWTIGERVPASHGGTENFDRNPDAQTGQIGDPAEDTASWGLRADYVLPSRELTPVDSGVFWPLTTDPLFYLVEEDGSSDHRLVWVDVILD